MAASYEYYRIFYYVGKYLSISKAAKELMNSQPNISRAMNNLENELGCKLLIRTHHGVKLTEEGELLFNHVKYAQKHFEIAESELEDKINPHKECLNLGFSIGISELVLYNIILPIMGDYLKQHQDVRVQVINDSTPALISRVKDGLIDLAIVTGSANDKECGVEWMTFRDLIIAGGVYKNLENKKLSLDELTRYPIISPRQGTETYQFYYDYFSSKGLLFQPEIETASADQVLPFVEQGMGIGFVAMGYAKKAIEQKSVVQISIKEDIPQRKVSILQNQNKNVSAAVEELKNKLLSSSLEDLEYVGGKNDVQSF